MPVGDTSIYASCSSDGTVKVWDCYRIERKFSINRSVEYCLPYLCYNLQQECLIVLSSLSSTVSFFFYIIQFSCIYYFEKQVPCLYGLAFHIMASCPDAQPCATYLSSCLVYTRMSFLLTSLCVLFWTICLRSTFHWKLYI